MELNKTNLNLVGIGGLLILLVFGGFFLVRPQIEAASDFNTKRDSVEMSVTNQTLRVTNLKEASTKIPELQESVRVLSEKIPSETDVGGIGRVAVEALGDGEILNSFQHFAPKEFVVPPTPKPSITAGGEELAATRGEAGSTETTEGVVADPAGPGAQKTSEKSRIKSFVDAQPQAVPLKQVPVTITVSVDTPAAAAAYVDRLAQGSRALLVQGITLNGSEAEGGNDVEAVIYAYAFVNGQKLL